MVLDQSTYLLVRDGTEELVWKKSVGEMELDPVEPCLANGFSSGIGVPLRVDFDFLSMGGSGCADKFKAGSSDLGSSRFVTRPKAQGWRRVYEPFAWTASTT